MTETEDGRPPGSASRDGEDGEGNRSVLVASVLAAVGSDSFLLKSYGVLGVLLAALVTVVVALAFPVWVFETLGQSPMNTFSGAFLLLIGLLVVGGLFAPLIFARRRRVHGEATRRSDFLLAATGYAFAGSLYCSLVISAPPGQRGTPPAAVAPVVEFLYGLDPAFAVAPPVLAAAAVLAVGYRLPGRLGGRSRSGSGPT